MLACPQFFFFIKFNIFQGTISPLRPFRTFSPWKPDKCFYVVSDWVKGLKVFYKKNLFPDVNVYARSRPSDDKTELNTKPVSLTNLQVVRNIWKRIFKVLIFWNRCLSNKNKTLHSHHKSSSVALISRSNVESTSTANSVALVMTKMDLCSVFAKFFQQVFKAIHRD